MFGRGDIAQVICSGGTCGTGPCSSCNMIVANCNIGRKRAGNKERIGGLFLVILHQGRDTITADMTPGPFNDNLNPC